jgi:hypothetical protein
MIFIDTVAYEHFDHIVLVANALDNIFLCPSDLFMAACVVKVRFFNRRLCFVDNLDPGVVEAY